VPPITILEDKPPNARSRRCVRLRRLLLSCYTDLIPQIIKRCQDLKDLVNEDNFERQIEIHEVADPDIQESFSGATISEIEDQESLRALRTMHLRFSVLRRVFLCYLLSLEANGSGDDIQPWKATLEAIESLAKLTGEQAEKLNDMLREDEKHNPIQSTTTQRNSPERERYRQQLRKTNELASELRTMQTKLLILRDDVSRHLEGPGSTTIIPPLFTTHAESIGQDLRALNQTYESWKTAIVPPSERADRRVSWTSSGLRSPISLGGLTVVDELGISGGPSDALRALSGESSGSGGSPVASVSDEEVFEAIAIPRLRRTMTREEKMMRLQEDETKRALAKEQRMASNNMMRELESVITSRSSKRMSTGRLLAAATRVSSL
jgi:Mysoin-binding motif of peroxisomes